MRKLFYSYRNRQLAIIFTVLTVSIFGIVQATNAATTAPPTLRTDIKLQATGQAPWDATTYDASTGANAAQDANSSNNIVRVLDTVVYRITVSLNDAADTNVISKVTLNKNQRWLAVPSSCLTQNVPTVSAISTDGRTLVCNLGNQQEGSNIVYDASALAVATDVNTPAGTDTSVKAANCDTTAYCLSAAAKASSDNHPSDVSATNTPFAYTTADFRVDMRKDNPTNDDTKPSAVTAMANDETTLGMMITYNISLNQQKGSEPVAHVNNMASFNLTDTFIYTGGSTNNSVLYTWGKGTASSCSDLLSNIGTLTCSQPGGPGTPITVSLTNVDLTKTTSAGMFARFSVRLWVPNSDITPQPSQQLATNNTIRGLAGLTSASGLANYGGTDEYTAGGTRVGNPTLSNNSIDTIVIALGPGTWSYRVTYGGTNATPGNTSYKPSEITAAPGQIVPLGLHIFDYRTTDQTSTACTQLNPNVELVGLAPTRNSGSMTRSTYYNTSAPVTAGDPANKVNASLWENPWLGMVSLATPQLSAVYKTSDFPAQAFKIQYSSLPFTDGGDQVRHDATCAQMI